MFEEGGCEWTGFSKCGEYKWSEGGLLDLADAFFIFATFGSFVLAVTRTGGRGSVRGCIRIKNVNVEECVLQLVAPESSCPDVESCLVVGSCCPTAEGLPCERL